MLDWLMVAGGLVLLFAGGEGLVRGAMGLSRRLGVSELVIGLTIVGFGTSMPELLVSVDAALADKPDIALGNIVGSNIANVLLILGVSALIAPISGWANSVCRDALAMTGAAVVLVLMSVTGTITSTFGLIMLALLAIYLVLAFRQTKSAAGNVAGREERWDWAALLVTVSLGLGALFAGAQLLVDGATAIAVDLGVSEAVIGLTVVAVGTSLPELSTSVIAAFRRNSAIAIGNVVGSNMFNIGGILGVTSVLVPVPISSSMAGFDIPLMMAVTLLLLAILWFFKKVSRGVGAAMLAVYGTYSAWLYLA
jgi:cation:H+ antiporter